MKAKIKTVLFKGKVLKDETFPVVFIVTYNKKRKHISSGVSCYDNEWNSDMEIINGPRFKKENKIIEIERKKVEDIILYFRVNNIPFSFEEFDKKYYDKEIGDVYEMFDVRIEELEKSGRLGSRNSTKHAKSAFKRFYDKEKLPFSKVNPAFLSQFEVFHLNNGCGKGGIAAYLRDFRTIFNTAIQRGLATREMYPFKNQFNANGYNMGRLKVKKNPRALSEVDMIKFMNFDIEKHPHLEEYHKIGMFIYYARGINFIDLSYLTWKDTRGGRIKYIRKKTHTPYSIKISENLQKILDYFSEVNETYVFPILSEFHATDQQKRDRIDKRRKLQNKKLKEIANILEIDDSNFTTYTFRHTYATTLKRRGASIASISEAMGHKTEEITNTYLKSFGDEKIDELDDLL